MVLIDAQRRRDEARTALLHAELLVQQALEAMDKPGMVSDPSMIHGWPVRDRAPFMPPPVPPPVPPSDEQKRKLSEVFAAIKAKTAAFFERNKVR